MFRTNDFIIRNFSPEYINIISISFKELFLIDIDFKDVKESPNEIIEKIDAKIQLLEAETNTKWKFELFYTDRGIHAYCVSQKFQANSKISILLSLYFEIDLNYIVSSIEGNLYNIRLSPKYDSEGVILPDLICFRDEHMDIGSGTFDNHLIYLLNIKLLSQYYFFRKCYFLYRNYFNQKCSNLSDCLHKSKTNLKVFKDFNKLFPNFDKYLQYIINTAPNDVVITNKTSMPIIRKCKYFFNTFNVFK